jgi:hypothetical protein
MRRGYISTGGLANIHRPVQKAIPTIPKGHSRVSVSVSASGVSNNGSSVHTIRSHAKQREESQIARFLG